MAWNLAPLYALSATDQGNTGIKRCIQAVWDFWKQMQNSCCQSMASHQQTYPRCFQHMRKTLEVPFSDYLQQQLISWNQSFWPLHSVDKMSKQELETLLPSSTVPETGLGQMRSSRKTTWQSSAHLPFDGLSLTMDHCVWSHYAVWAWVCLHHFKLHCTHPSTHQEDVTCKTPHVSGLLQPTSAKCQSPYDQQPEFKEVGHTGRHCGIYNTALHAKLKSCIHCNSLSTVSTLKFHPAKTSKQ